MLDLGELAAADLPGVTREKGAELSQAAAVCLQSQGHQPGVRLVTRGDFDNAYALAWPPVSGQALRTWNDPEETTEDGAVGVAVLLSLQELGWPVILRSWRGTGFDYWLGSDDQSRISDAERAATDALRDLLRDDNLVVRGVLEVSGIRQGSDREIQRRVNAKLRQIARFSHWNLPGYVIVVEFSHPLAEVRAR